MERNDRLDFLKRKNAGRLLLPELRAELAPIFDLRPEDLNFISVEKSDEIHHRAAQCFPPRQQLQRNIGEYPFIRKLLSNALSSRPLLPDEADDVFLRLDPDGDSVGVLQLTTASVNKCWQKLLNIRPDGFTLIDSRCLNQCVVDINTDEIPGQSLIDVAVWGPRWSEFIRASL